MKAAIDIQHLGKKYRVRQPERYMALRDVISQGARHLFKRQSSRLEDFWALDDIDLAIEPGERVGIIGRNGAGKSTLLRILSRVTSPTTGGATIRGRLASLLEVGTGFHPELTGRENVYFNGSVLGMKKAEIDRQFDAIVDFSGVERFLDTPLKNYSSGMQLRLAFAVAAHLEPEVLLIDEVLAVGDLEFQKKCIGKMEEVSKQHGRTILFVSHNLHAVNNLCNRAVLLEQGKIAAVGSTEDVTTRYIRSTQARKTEGYQANVATAAGALFIREAALQNASGESSGNFYIADDLFIETTIEKKTTDTSFLFRIAIHDIHDQRIVLDQQTVTCPAQPCYIKCRIKIPSSFLAPNQYSWVLALLKQGAGVVDNQRNILPFTILKENTRFEDIDYDYGFINQPFEWHVQSVPPSL